MTSSRRAFLHSALSAGLLSPWTRAAAGVGQPRAWSDEHILHLLPTANHNRLQLKAVFAEPTSRPELRIGNRRIPGRPTDAGGEGYAFDVSGLIPDTTYELSLWQQRRRLCDNWPLATMPAPDAAPERLRLLVYTGAGGHPRGRERDNPAYLPLATHRRLLACGLAFEPDAVIAIGDQPESLYGTRLRATPCFFVKDDHHYFDNDEVTDRFVTLPPQRYQRAFSAFVRNRYLPDFLPARDDGHPLTGDNPDGGNARFGTLRWGRLAELLIYACAGHLGFTRAAAGLVPADVEAWLARRTHASPARQLLHIPSHPMGWRRQAARLLAMPGDQRMDQRTPAIEKEGVTIVDVTPDSVRLQRFAWRRETQKET